MNERLNESLVNRAAGFAHGAISYRGRLAKQAIESFVSLQTETVFR